jgi:deoxyadenosine/deoxycytidine kinase
MSTIPSISIEGNIGSGKSSLLAHIIDNESGFLTEHSINPIYEPVNNWSTYRDAEGTTILEHFYRDMPRYAFPFQMLAYFTRYEIYMKARGNLLLTERSLDTDRYIFAQMQADIGNIDDICMQIYRTWFDFHAKDVKVAGRIYVRTMPQLCYERIAHRARKGEEGIRMELLEGYHRYHESWLMSGAGEPVLVLDGSLPLQSHIPDIKRFIKELMSKYE